MMLELVVEGKDIVTDRDMKLRRWCGKLQCCGSPEKGGRKGKMDNSNDQN